MSHHSGQHRGHGAPRSSSSGSIEVFNPRGASSEAHVSSRELSELTSRFQAMSSADTGKLLRPGFGVAGTPIKLRSNLFQVHFPKDVALYDYAIDITPKLAEQEKDLKKYIVSLFSKSRELDQFKDGVAHDGVRRLIAKQPLPRGFMVGVKGPAPPLAGNEAPSQASITYTVALVGPKELNSADLARYLRGDDPKYDPVPIVSAFNLVVTAHAARTGARALTKHAYYFNPTENTGVHTRPGLSVVNGFFASVQPVFKSLMVNVNTCMSAFYVPREHLSDALIEFLRQSKGATPQQFFGMMRVTTRYLGYPRRFTVKGFGSSSARKTVIKTDEFGRVSVEQYFQKKYGITLRHADDLPVVILGNQERNNFVPAELCRIEPGTLFSGRLVGAESAALCTANSKTPAAQEQIITVKGLRLMGLEGNDSPAKDFNIKIALSMTNVNARVLSTPAIIYKSGRPPVVNGSWTIRGIRFAQPAQLSRLAILVLRDGDLSQYGSKLDADLRDGVTALLSKCKAYGMAVDPEYVVRVVDLPRPRPDDPYREEALLSVSNTLSSLPGKPRMVVALVSNRDPQIHAGLRRAFDTQLGVRSLCAMIPNILEKDGRDQYLGNLAVKMNAKLGGINHMLEPSSLKWLQNTMLVGMSISRPGGDAAKGTPSIAAVTASCDSSFFQYPTSVSLQPQDKSSITNLREMIIERMKNYRDNMDSFPQRIIVFRNGVTSSQQVIVKAEIDALRRTFRELSDKPKLTYIICSKGHKTRFYPATAEQADRTSNSVAGTVVDQGVTSIYDFDFYLQAHATSQGVARAAHYTVVYDENKFPPDVLQQGINDISYLWAPSSNSVSLAPPAFWASRACSRARLYLHKLMAPVEGSKETKLNPSEVEERARGLWQEGVHDSLKGTMYYM